MTGSSDSSDQRSSGPGAPPAPGGFSRQLAVLAIVAATTLLAAQVVSHGLADMIAQSQPEAIISLRVDHAPALLRLAEKQLAANEADNIDERTLKASAERVWSMAHRVMELEPVNVKALRLLGEAAYRRGDEALAVRLMTAAAERSIRDSATNVWLTNYELRQRDYHRALSRIDALLRTDPTSRDEVLPALVAIAQTPDAGEELIGLIGKNVPWRAWFITQLPERASDLTGLMPLYLRLIVAPAPITAAELKPYLDRLISRNLIEQAYYVWMQFLPPERLAQVGYLYNGTFDLRQTNLPFDWVLQPIEGANIRFAPIPGGDGRRALFVEFIQKRVRFRNVTQMTLLSRGHYRLSGRYKANDLNNSRGMTWRIYCAEQQRGPIAETDRVSGTTAGWKDFEITFEVPEPGCRAQWIRLELAARIDAEEEVSGSIWYDDLSISKLDRDTSRLSSTGSAPRIVQPSAETSFERAIRQR